MAKVNSKCTFFNVLSSTRLRSTLEWAGAHKSFPSSKNPTSKLSPAQIIETAVSADTVQKALWRLESELNWPSKAIDLELKQTSETLAHRFNFSIVRMMAAPFKVVFETLWTGIYVNEKEVEQLRPIFEKYPVVFLPTHRSYADFLILSFLCFQYELPLPAIATAMDFLGMKGVSSLLSRLGGFFIKRNGGPKNVLSPTDELYWALFTEYVQEHVRSQARPLEFFIEGTRSRTGKSLHPKVGLLSCILEPYFKGEVDDVFLVPVSLSYTRVFEERLYGFELLGFPKPKESTTGFWKARSILNDNFGDVWVKFPCKPISARQLIAQESGLERVSHALQPQSSFSWTEEEQKHLKRLACKVVKEQQRNMVVTSWPFLALSALTWQRQKSGSWEPVPVNELLHQARLLFDLAAKCGMAELLLLNGSVYKESVNWKSELDTGLALHGTLSELDANGRFGLKPSEVPVSIGDVESDLMVPILCLQRYANELMHVFYELSIMAVVTLAKNPANLSWTISSDNIDTSLFVAECGFLQHAFHREFVPVPHEPWDSDGSLRKLFDSFSREQILLLAQILHPFLLAYASCAHLVQRPSDWTKTRKTTFGESEFVRAAQIALIQDGAPFQTLSTDLLKNALHTFVSSHAVAKRWSNQTIDGSGGSSKLEFEVVDRPNLEKLENRLRRYVLAVDKASNVSKVGPEGQFHAKL